MDCDTGMSTWRKYKRLVKWTIWKIIRAYGGDYEELYSEALLLYAQALESYEPEVGTLQTWLSYKIYKGLQELKRTECRRAGILGERLPSETLLTVSDSQSNLHRIWVDLSTDGQHALRLFLTSEESSVRNTSLCKLSVRYKLKDDGWENDRINVAFNEIKEALV